MFERFTGGAREVIVHAQEEARTLTHGSIGTEHILLGLMRESEGFAAQALQSSGLWLDQVRTAVVAADGGSEAVEGQIPFTPNAKHLLERALREAVRMSHNYIGTEHLLLGLLRLQESIAYKVLLDLGADPEEIRGVVIALVEERPERRQLPYDPELSAVLGRATDLAVEDGAERVEVRHLRQALDAP
jgi:ATP-dependent Clp protease ATP-binding subunit ClpC